MIDHKEADRKIVERTVLADIYTLCYIVIWGNEEKTMFIDKDTGTGEI